MWLLIGGSDSAEGDFNVVQLRSGQRVAFLIFASLVWCVPSIARADDAGDEAVSTPNLDYWQTQLDRRHEQLQWGNAALRERQRRLELAAREVNLCIAQHGRAHCQRQIDRFNELYSEQ